MQREALAAIHLLIAILLRDFPKQALLLIPVGCVHMLRHRWHSPPYDVPQAVCAWRSFGFRPETYWKWRMPDLAVKPALTSPCPPTSCGSLPDLLQFVIRYSLFCGSLFHASMPNASATGLKVMRPWWRLRPRARRVSRQARSSPLLASCRPYLTVQFVEAKVEVRA